MSYNYRKEYAKWKRWKEQEERILKQMNMPKNKINELREFDWAQFNDERRFTRKQNITNDQYFALIPVNDKKEFKNINDILDSIEDEALYEYLKDELKMIKRSKVKLTKCQEEIEVKNEYIIKSFIVSSMRLDKIISSFYKISRQKAAEFIRAGHVKVNHKPVEQINYLCNNKDIISFKKHGRVMFVDCNRQTRSNNYVVEGYFYK